MKCILIIILTIISLNANSQISQKLKNRDSVAAIIAQYDIQHPDIVLRQAMFESGWLMCNSCSWNLHGNPFGFFYKGKYLDFESIHKAVAYYKWWQDQLYKGGDYYEFLEKIGYAEATGYIRELKRMW